MKKRGRALAGLLATLALICLLPTAALADEGSATITPEAPDGGTVMPIKGSDLQSATDLLNQMGEPAGFAEDTVTPFGTAAGEQLMMMEDAELFSYYAVGGKTQSQLLDGARDVTVGPESQPSQTNFASTGNVSGIGALRFAQAVSFDATGGGRRNHVAIVGLGDLAKAKGSDNKDHWSATAYVYIVDADQSKVVHTYTFNPGEGWATALSSLTTVDSHNFFQATAGDYNGDGRDSVVVYFGSNELYEVGQAADGSWASQNLGSGCLHDSYGDMWRSWNLSNRLCASLASGDANGDGIDDLVAVSYTGRYDTKQYPDRADVTKATLAVAFGAKGVTWANDLSVSKDVIFQDGKTLAAPGVSVGDIDGDGANEVMVAGYLNNWSAKEPVNIKDGKNDTRVAYTYYRCGGGTLARIGGIQGLTDVSAMSKDDSLREKESLWQQLAVECVSFDGRHTADYVFINGYSYQLSDGSLVRADSSLDTSDLAKRLGFNKLVERYDGGGYSGGSDIDEVFVNSATVANLYSDKSGREAVVFSVGYKTHTNEQDEDEKEGNYYFVRVIARHADDGWHLTWKTNVGHSIGYFDGYDTSSRKYQGSSGTAGLSCVFAAVDYGYDSVIVRYNGKEYTYSDPVPVAFLQAAPYYNEFDPGNSATSYSYSESYGTSQGSASQTSYSIGAAMQVDVPGVSIAADVGASYEKSEEFLATLDKTYQTTFETNGQNQVIVRRTLLYSYFYDVLVGTNDDGTPKWEKASLMISVPKYPVLSSLSMDQYDALAQAYNDRLAADAGNAHLDQDHTMDVISANDGALMAKYHLNNEGNPFAYASSADAYGKDRGFDMSTGDWMALSHAGGVSTQTFSSSVGSEQTQTSSGGVYTNLTVMAGATTPFVQAYAGVSTGYEKLSGTVFSTSRVTTTETSGTVQNLDAGDTDFRFSWRLIGWKTDPADRLFDGVLFVGYAVRDQVALPAAPTDLAASYSRSDGRKVTLTWTSPDAPGRSPIDEFRVYRVDGDDEELLGTVANAGAGQTHGAAIDVGDYEDLEATYAVRSVHKGSLRERASIRSNEAHVIFALTDEETRALVEAAKADLQAKIDALQQAVGEGQSEALAQAVADLTAAYQAADAQLKGELAAADERAKVELQGAIDAARGSLQAAIDQVRADLDAARAELSASIAAGDAASADALRQAVEDVNASYAAADALLRSGLQSQIDALGVSTDDLRASSEAADQALRDAIDQVRADLDQSHEGLSAAIEAGDAANAAALAQATSDLTAAYERADALLGTRVDGVVGSLSDLASSVASADQALRAAIEQLRSNLEATKAELEKAQAAGDEANAKALQEAVESLTQADASMSEAHAAAQTQLGSRIQDLTSWVSGLEASTAAADQRIEGSAATAAQSNASRFSELGSSIGAARSALADATAAQQARNQAFESADSANADATEAARASADDADAEIRDEIAQQGQTVGSNGEDIAAVRAANESQGDELSTLKVIAIVAVILAAASAAANVALLLRRVLGRRQSR